jgi:hypothetical protein
MFAIGRDGGHEKIPKVSSLCPSGGSQLEDFMKEIFSCSSVTSRRCPEGNLLEFALRVGTANLPENVSKKYFFLQSLKK